MFSQGLADGGNGALLQHLEPEEILGSLKESDFQSKGPCGGQTTLCTFRGQVYAVRVAELDNASSRRPRTVSGHSKSSQDTTPTVHIASGVEAGPPAPSAEPAENPFKLTFVQEEEKDTDEAGPVISEDEEEEEAPASVRSTTALKACTGLETKEYVEEVDAQACALGMSVPAASL